MTHRSNQAVASQARPPPQPQPPPPPAAPRTGWRWGTLLGLFGAGAAALAAGLWFLRLPLAELALHAALEQRGAETDFRFVSLDFGAATLAEVRLGPEADPDATVRLVEAQWGWRGFTPELRSLRLVAPEVSVNLDRSGRLSAGALDALRTGEPGPRRPSAPRIRLDIEDGAALITAPFGLLRADISANGVIGRDFSALAHIEETSQSSAAYSLQGGTADLILVSNEDSLSFRFIADAGRLDWNGLTIAVAHVTLNGHTPLDLARLDGEAVWRIGALNSGALTITNLAGAAGAGGAFSETGLRFTGWRGESRVNAERLGFAARALTNAQFNMRAEGQSERGAGAASFTAASLSGQTLQAPLVNAAGEFSFDNNTLTAEARANLRNAALSADAQQSIRDALPALGGAPVGPALAQVEAALDAAADRFDLALPFSFTATGNGARLTLSQAGEARAASGARVRLAPLRDDAPALVMAWPGGALHGAVEIVAEGGGLPRAQLLLDALDWAPGAPFEADGTLALSNWSAGGSRIGAEELRVAIATQPQGGGRVDIAGPLALTGPVGEGEVRDLVADLDLAVIWGNGWRVAPNAGCLPVRIGGLDAAGLSFSAGALRLCPAQGGALIAANAQGQLSDGFVIEGLRLNGRLAGPAAQPAHLTAGRVVGRFSGAQGDLTLALEAAAPSLSVEMDPARTLTVTGERLTADAHFANQTWRVDGVFEQGALDDPNLPGEVTAIAGRWSAVPEESQPIVRIDAGEAFLTAHAASATDQRPLFNPMRFSEVRAEMRDGGINAEGAVVLNAKARNLARFTAAHDISAGSGHAHFTATAIMFDDSLQPFEITELARGVVENVLGPASGDADLVWGHGAVNARARVRLEGVSLATATIPVIENVRGEIMFDDLLALTTPPGQSVTVGRVSLGIAAQNGRVRFQLLPDARVAVEQAEFDFASGVLALEPSELELGADEAELRLVLRDVDAAQLISQLNWPDLSATGRIEGTFPLLLTRTTAYVKDGVLRAAPGGGVISYTGAAGDSATGPSRVAFQVLRSFHYDDLSITLNGDTSGEVVSTIHFAGENVGRAVDLTDIAQVPGVGRVTARGVPFLFNVTVTAPFRRLAQTAAGFVDPRDIIESSVTLPGEEDDQDAAPEEP